MKLIKKILNIVIDILSKTFNFFYSIGFKKIFFLMILISLLLVMFWLITATLTGGWLHQLQFNRSQSLERVADSVQTFELKDLSKFTDLFPPQQYSVLLEKIIVNLKPEAQHRVPMGAFHIYLKVDSRRTAILIRKIRQKMHDKIQRRIEELTYSEIQGPEGLKKLKSVIKDQANKTLSFSKGKVYNVYFKTIITKP